MDSYIALLSTLIIGSYIFTAAIAKWLYSRIEKILEHVFNHQTHQLELIENKLVTLIQRHKEENMESRVSKLEEDS